MITTLKPRVILESCAAIFVFSLALFTHQETSGEGWSYWFFARIFSETGEFVANDRSPIYTLYLNLFRWLPYPLSINSEHIISSLFALSGIVILAKSFVSTRLSIFIALLWFPYLQFAEPPVQKIALSFSLWGLFFRRQQDNQAGLPISYCLFLLSYMFRSSYLVLLIFFIVWDLINLLKNQHPDQLLREIKNSSINSLKYFIPLLICIGLLFWFSLNESAHPWNNPQSMTTDWVPTKDSKSLADAHFIQAWNWRYIESEYGTFVNHDWYFTNNELFNGADNWRAAFFENPRFVTNLTSNNIKPAITTVAKFTELRYLPFLRIWDIALLGFILAALIITSRDRNIGIYIIASVIIVAVSASALPGTKRHFVALVPLLILSAGFYGKLLCELSNNRYLAIKNWLRLATFSVITLSILYYLLRIVFAPQTGSRTLYALAVGLCLSIPTMILWIHHSTLLSKLKNRQVWTRSIIMMVFLILLSHGSSKWISLLNDLTMDLKTSEIKVLENSKNSVSMKASLSQIKSLTKECRGIISLEPTFFGAFLDVPLSNIYDIWEIPPFGNLLSNTDYEGLHPKRIDCVLVSKHFATTIGHATNAKLRYDNYIVPYITQLQQLGASIHQIDRYGHAIILNKEG